MNKLFQFLFFFALSFTIISCGDQAPENTATAQLTANTSPTAVKVVQPLNQTKPQAMLEKAPVNVNPSKSVAKPDQVDKKSLVKWYTWEEAIAANKKNKKKIFVDIYTDWCGWCKRMDATTFSDPKIAKHMNDNFYCIKLDAEQKENIQYAGHTYKYIANYGRKGVHELAFTLLDGRMSYPQYVFMDENEGKLNIVKGYKKVPEFTQELEYISSNAYKTKSLATFKSTGK